MSTQTCEAIFQDGAFRPVRPVPRTLIEGQHVHLIVKTADENVLQLATGIYDGLSNAEVKEIEQIALDRHDFFEKTA